MALPLPLIPGSGRSLQSLFDLDFGLHNDLLFLVSLLEVPSHLVASHLSLCRLLPHPLVLLMAPLKEGQRVACLNDPRGEVVELFSMSFLAQRQSPWPRKIFRGPRHERGH